MPATGAERVVVVSASFHAMASGMKYSKRKHGQKKKQTKPNTTAVSHRTLNGRRRTRFARRPTNRIRRRRRRRRRRRSISFIVEVFPFGKWRSRWRLSLDRTPRKDPAAASPECRVLIGSSTTNATAWIGLPSVALPDFSQNEANGQPMRQSIKIN